MNRHFQLAAIAIKQNKINELDLFLDISHMKKSELIFYESHTVDRCESWPRPMRIVASASPGGFGSAYRLLWQPTVAFVLKKTAK